MMVSSLRNQQLHDILRDAEPGNRADRPANSQPTEPTAMIEHLKDEFGDYSADPLTSNWFWREDD
jgi:hypothetical protein